MFHRRLCCGTARLQSVVLGEIESGCNFGLIFVRSTGNRILIRYDRVQHCVDLDRCDATGNVATVNSRKWFPLLSSSHDCRRSPSGFSSVSHALPSTPTPALDSSQVPVDFPSDFAHKPIRTFGPSERPHRDTGSSPFAPVASIARIAALPHFPSETMPSAVAQLAEELDAHSLRTPV